MQIEIKERHFNTVRRGDPVRIQIPKGGRIELRPSKEHCDVQIREATGAVARNFRILREDG